MGSELVLQEEQPAAPPSGGALVAVAILPGLGAPTQYNMTYPRSKLWEDPDAGCQKKCCQTQGHYLALQIGDKHGDQLKKARKAKQKKDISAKFPTLHELRDEKHLNYTIPVGEDETTVIKFDSTSIGQQMLQCVDRQFFAGFTQEQLDTLVSTGTVHPQTLLTETKGTYHLHTLNYMHLRGWKLAKQYQKFVLLASAGEIVHHVDGHAMHPDAKAQKVTQFESLLYIQKKGKKRSTPFKGKWNELSEFCRDFYRTVVLAPDSRVEFKKCILEPPSIASHAAHRAPTSAPTSVAWCSPSSYSSHRSSHQEFDSHARSRDHGPHGRSRRRLIARAKWQHRPVLLPPPAPAQLRRC